MFGGFLDEVQLSVTTFRPSNIISRVTLTRTTTLLMHPDYDDVDTNGDDEYDADESDADDDDDDDHNDFDDLDFGQAGLVYIYSLFFLILVVLMIVLAVVVVVVEAVVFTKMFPERFYLRPVQEHFCKCLVGFWTKCSFR